METFSFFFSLQSLENALKEAEISSGKPLGSITGVLDDGLSNYQSLLENWEVLARANATRPTNGESTPQGKMESEMTSPLENMQMAFSAGRPPTTATTTTNNSSLSSYHPNAVFVGGVLRIYYLIIYKYFYRNNFSVYSLLSVTCFIKFLFNLILSFSETNGPGWWCFDSLLSEPLIDRLKNSTQLISTVWLWQNTEGYESVLALLQNDHGS